MGNSMVPFERILAPIPAGFRKENEYDAVGSGRDYAYDYLDIEEARRVVVVSRMRGDADDEMRQKAQPQPKSADWDKVFALGVNVLATESKDLRVAAWVVEALGHLRGFAGLRDGFTMFRLLQGRYRDSAYPRDDGDLKVRHGPYEFLEGERILPFLIRTLPLISAETGEPLSYLNCKEAERNENQAAEDARSGESGESDASKFRLKDWQAAIETTPVSEIHRLAGDVAACLIAFRAWERSTDRLWRDKKSPPSLSRIGEALVDCAREVQKMFLDPDQPEAATLALAVLRQTSGRPPALVRPVADFVVAPARDDQPVVTPSSRAEGTPDFEPLARVEETLDFEPLAPETTVRHADPSIVAGPAGPPEDVETAYRRVQEAAAFLRSANPNDPVPYLLIRSLRLGELFGMDAGLTDEPHPGPSSETRKELRRRTVDGNWEEVVELTEEILSRPEGRCWIDAHRLAIRGLEECGRDHAARACRSLLAAALDHAPELADGELDDGTPAASAETRDWLARSLNRTLPRDRTTPDEDTTEVAPLSPTDPPVDAEAALREGRAEDAIAIFSRSLDAAPGDRARYLATIQFAEACIGEGLDQMAIPLLEALVGSADEASLRSWEGRSFFVSGATLLHGVLARIDNGVLADRLARAHARLAHLAPAAGLRHGGR